MCMHSTCSTCTYWILQALYIEVCIYVFIYKHTLSLKKKPNNLLIFKYFLPSNKIRGRHYQNIYFEKVSIMSPKDYAYAV